MTSAAGAFAVIFAAGAGLWLFDSFLARMDRSETQAEARRYFGEGQALAAAGRSADAVERFRSAVAIARDNRDYQLALANALLGIGKPTAAETVTNEVLLRDSTDGPANLTMARINVDEGHLADAASYYHRAIYGRWPSDPAGNGPAEDGRPGNDAAAHRMQVRLELIDILARQHAKQELLAELLAVEDQVSDTGTQKHLARLFLAAGTPARSAALFQTIIDQQPDGDAYAGLGEAELELRNYTQARAAFQAALNLNRGDTGLRKRLALTDEVLLLDPRARGLRVSERYRRSVLLLKRTQDLLSGCAGSAPRPKIADLIGKADKALKSRIRPSGEGDALDANIDLSLELWKARGRKCGPVNDSDQPLALVLAEMSR
jgi:tetratricopeptide (TPR) repeat protein